MTKPTLDLDGLIADKLGIDRSPVPIRVGHKTWKFKGIVTQADMSRLGEYLLAADPIAALGSVLVDPDDADALFAAISANYAHDAIDEVFLQVIEAAAGVTLPRADDLVALVDAAIDGVDLSGLDPDDIERLETIKSLNPSDPASRAAAFHLLGQIGEKVQLNAVADDDAPVDEDGDTPGPKGDRVDSDATAPTPADSPQTYSPTTTSGSPRRTTGSRTTSSGTSSTGSRRPRRTPAGSPAAGTPRKKT